MTAIADLLSSLRIGEPLNLGAVFAAPVYAGSPIDLDLLTLDQALAQDALLVRETSSEGTVAELIAENCSEFPVFLLDGEQVLGLKQNRTFNLSMVIPPKQQITIPVSCLERGRWSARASAPAASEHVHFASGRAMKMRSVSESLREQRSYRSDQRQVWSDIDEKLDEACHSHTAAEADFYMVRKAEFQRLVAELEPQPDQVGVIFGRGAQLTGFDLFGSSALYARLHTKLVRSYLLDADRGGVNDSPPAPDLIRRKLDALLSEPEEVFAAPGTGETHRWSGAAGHAAALVVSERCVHAAGFWNS